MIGIGLLGASKIAPNAIIRPAALREDCVIQAVAARDETRAQAYADKYDIPHVETSYEALIARDDIDLIYNALPPSLHCELAILAAQHGKAVLCEKPFAMNADEARRMVDAATAAGTVLIEAFHYRYHPAFLAFEAILKSGKIGDIEDISGVFDIHLPNRAGELRYVPELGGGAMMDLGCYPLHALRLLTEQEPVVTEASNELHPSGVALSSWASLTFGDVPGVIDCNMGQDAIADNRIHVVGSLGVAKFVNFVQPHEWNPQTGFEIYVEVDGRREITTLLNVPESWKRSTYEYQLDHVVKVMRGEVAALTGGEDAIATMTAIDAVLAS